MNHVGAVRMETERLILRPFVSSDAQPMFDNWASDPEVTKFLTWPTHTDVDVTRRVIDLWVKVGECDPSSYNWCIALRDSDEPIGSIAVVSQDEFTSTLEIGYCLSRRFWGQGLVPEAARAVLDFLLNVVGASAVTAKHDLNNPNSGRVMQKCGMQLLEIRRGAEHNNQGVCDVAVYCIDNPNA